LDLGDSAGVAAYIDNLATCSTFSGQVCAWVEAHAYRFQKTTANDFLVAVPALSHIDAAQIATAGKELPTMAIHQDLIYSALCPIADAQVQSATKARIDIVFTTLATKSLTAQGYQPGEASPATGGATATTATTATEREDDAITKHTINKWRLHLARIETDPVTGAQTVVLPKDLAARLLKLIHAKSADNAYAYLKDLYKTPVPTSSDCVFLPHTVGCSELADHGLALAIKRYNMSERAPTSKDDLINALSPIFHACHLDREHPAVIQHMNSLTRMAREDKVATDKTKRKSDLQFLGQRASLTDLQRAIGNLQYWHHCMLPDYTSNPNKPVVDRIVTTYFSALRDEMGSNFAEKMIHQFPHCVTQWMTTVQGLLCQIQTFVNSVPDDFDELAIDPSIFTTPLLNAASMARDFAAAMAGQHPPHTLSNEVEPSPPSTSHSTHPPSVPTNSLQPRDRTNASARTITRATTTPPRPAGRTTATATTTATTMATTTTTTATTTAAGAVVPTTPTARDGPNRQAFASPPWTLPTRRHPTRAAHRTNPLPTTR
jgi:hypothetical protein